MILFYVFMDRKPTVSLPLSYYKGSFLILYVLGQRDGNTLWALEVCHYTSESTELILVDIFISLEFGNPQQSSGFQISVLKDSAPKMLDN